MQSLERLRLLLVLTVADIRAVGPKTWNGWKARAAARALLAPAEELSGGLSSAGGARSAPPRPWRRSASELADWGDGGDRAPFRPRPRGLLAVVRRRGARPPGPAGAPRPRRSARRSPSRPASTAARLDRGHDLHRRPPRPVLRSRRRHCARRRQHRRRPDLHPDQRHGARHLLDPGRRGRRVRAARRLARLAASVEHVIGDSAGEIQREIAIPPPALPSRDRALPGDAARADRQPRQRHLHRDRGERPRPPGPPPSPDPRAHRPQAADRHCQDLDLRRARRRRVLRQGPCSA